MLSPSVPLTVEEKLRVQTQLLNVVEQAILAVDLTGIIVLWNHFAETLYGWSMEEVQGRNIEEILSAPQLMESVRTNLDQLKHGKVWSGEILVKQRNGSTFMAQISASLIRN
jgi:PAS domain S-box-containing protein